MMPIMADARRNLTSRKKKKKVCHQTKGKKKTEKKK